MRVREYTSPLKKHAPEYMDPSVIAWDVLERIAILTGLRGYLALSLTCRHFAGICINTVRRDRIINHFLIQEKSTTIVKWRLGPCLHRGGDLPAVISNGGRDCEWFYKGRLHRENGRPAIVYANGTRKWYRFGRLERANDLPAEVTSGGIQKWYHKGVLHRGGDEPAIIHPDGTREWYDFGKRHRDHDQPAVMEANGTLKWFWKNKLHRAFGRPAIEYAKGGCEFWINGVRIQ